MQAFIVKLPVMAIRIDPPHLSSKAYELYRQELLAWREVTELRKEGEIDTLIAFLDKHLKKDDLADGLEKFEEFEDFQRNPEMSISEFIATFDSR